MQAISSIANEWKGRKKNERMYIYFNIQSSTVDRLRNVGNESPEFHGERAAEARNRGGEDRQLQLRAGNADSAGGNYSDMDQPRRHSPHGGQHGRCIQIQSARHR